jgi:hypothetical protein
MTCGPRIERLIFLHLGRTGGTTLRREVLLRCAGPDAVYYLGPAEPPLRGGTLAGLLTLSRRELERLRVVVGHMPFGLRELLPRPDRWHYAAFLRDPVARAASEYYQIRATPGHPLHPLAGRCALEEFVRRRCGLSWNGLCQWLSNRAFGTPFADDEAMFRAALRNAEACAFVGLTEHFDESVRRLCRLCGWEAPRCVPLNCHTPPGRVLSAGEEAALRANTALDQRLYDHFRARFWRPPAGDDRPPCRAAAAACPG